MSKYVLALDQGTTSSRAIVFDHSGKIVSVAQEEFPQILPSPGHVEHDPEAIWSSQFAVARNVLAAAKIDASDVTAIGIANQRETTILWDRDTGKPVDNAIVWQSRITANICEELKKSGYEATIRQKTGLVVDPYFSGTKVKYLLDKHDGLRARAERGEILFGTVDSYLIWRMSGGKSHVTDVSNASRTLLFNIHTMDWDDELLDMLDVPREMLPKVRPSSCVLTETDPDLFGIPIPIAGVCGRSAGRDIRPSLFRYRVRQKYLRHGMLLAAERWEEAHRVQFESADNGGLAAGRRRHVLPGRFHIRRRRRRAMVTRRAGHHQAFGRC